MDRADTVRGAESKTRSQGHATIVYGIHEADEGHVRRTTVCAQTQTGRQMASSQIPGARSYINAVCHFNGCILLAPRIAGI